jgi:hypothetical protein
VCGTYGTHGRGEVCEQCFDVKTRKNSDHLEDQGIDGRMGSEWILGRLARGVLIGFSWLRIETGGGIL